MYIQIIVVCYIYFGHFLAENILSINLKFHFPRWRVGHKGILPVMNRSILVHYLKMTLRIQVKIQVIKTLNVSFVMENSPRMNEEKFGLSVSAVFSGRSELYRSRARRVHL